MSAPAHTAKLAAIEALEAGTLSAAGSARLLRHLSRCALCRNTQRGLRVHTALVASVRLQTPTIDFARMELALRRQAQMLAARRRRARLLLPALVAAVAAAMVITVLPRVSPREPQAPTTPTTPTRNDATTARAEVTTRRHATLSALRGTGLVRSENGHTRPLTVDSEIVEGESLELSSDGEAHVQLASATAVVVEPGTVVRFARLRSASVELALASGAVTSQVQTLGPAERYEVRAAGYTVAVRGTHFRVSTTGLQLTAAVRAGQVAILDATGMQLADLRAPASFDTRRGATASVSETLPAPHVLSLPLSAWPVLSLPAAQDVLAWTLDGQRFAASAELHLRVPRGEVVLHAELANGDTRRAALQVPEGGLRVETAALARLLRVHADHRPSAALEASAIRDVLASGMPALSRCYELALKQRPDVAGRLTLRITTDGAGRVTRITPRSHADDAAQPVPEPLVSCIRNVAQRWQFPAPGGSGLTFDAPIRLTRAR